MARREEGMEGKRLRASAAVDERTPPQRAAVALALALAALSTLDLVVTEIGVSRFGAVELNPLIAPLLGTMWAPLLKVGLPTVIVLFASRIRTRFVFRALRTLVAAYLVVAVFTTGQLLLVVA
jgi:hypothetical protein